jgi:hypothetical protein
MALPVGPAVHGQKLLLIGFSWSLAVRKPLAWMIPQDLVVLPFLQNLKCLGASAKSFTTIHVLIPQIAGAIRTMYR